MVVLSRLLGCMLLAATIYLQWPMLPGMERYLLGTIAALGWSAAWFGDDFDAWLHLGPDLGIRAAGLIALVVAVVYPLL